MNTRYVIVLNGSGLIARDIREEIISLAPDTRVETASNPKAAARSATGLDALDLLVVSERSHAAQDPHLRQLADAARAILVIGERPVDLPGGKTLYASDAPFSADSLRRDLMSINLDGGPLFPRLSPAPQH